MFPFPLPVSGFPRGSAGAILGSSNQVVNGGPVIPVVTVTLARHDEFIGTLARHDESKMARNIIVNRPEKKAKKKKA